ncbi:MAG TPA: hypothetical protein VF774_25845 [Pseudoduganella sp.]|jgi:uncharacterized membrane protein
MFGLTSLGTIHTAISLVALAAGFISLARTGLISWTTRHGLVYVIATVLTCLTGFGIFQRGGFNEAHMLGVVTLLTLGVAWLAARHRLGSRSRYIEAVALSLTLYFHFIPGITETSLRFPAGAPLAANTEEPWLKAVVGVLFLVFLLGAWLQVRHLRARHGPAPQPQARAA